MSSNGGEACRKGVERAVKPLGDMTLMCSPSTSDMIRRLGLVLVSQ